jgi:hypothetical protein
LAELIQDHNQFPNGFTLSTGEALRTLGGCLYLFFSLQHPAYITFLVSDNISISGEILNIAMVVNSANSSGVGRMWLGAIPESFHPEPVPYMLQFTNPTQFSVGSNNFGVLEITERRQIVRSFMEMIGSTPVCNVLHDLFLIWLTPLDRPELQLYRFDINSSACAQDTFEKSAHISLFQV